MRNGMVSGDSKIRSGGGNFKALIHKRPCLASLALNDAVPDRCQGSRRFSYEKLPQLQNLKLSVLKLDGSEFEVHIVKNATLAELKMAIEEVFGSSPKEGQDTISWSLVWGHFCLCYEGKKLINDKAQIRNYGIKEGDQLQFIRHMSMNYSPPRFKRRLKKETIARRRNLMLLPSSSNDWEETEQIGANACDPSNEIDRESKYENRSDKVPGESYAPQQFKMAHLLRGLVSYSKPWNVRKSRSSSSDSKSMRSTRFALQFFRI